ncbi:MAG: hypothetical protein IT285_06230, partial [Bdellovibrionales bacterium]|nr:hypothetical protein [Bdellovibrionales bacterium]
MDNAILKKRLNTFRAGKSGRLQEISNDVIVAVHRAWENWPGTTTEFCRELGVSSPQMGVIIKKGKSLIKSGAVTESEFQELAAALGPGDSPNALGPSPCSAIELSWSEGRVIRFPRVDELLDFLKKAA